MSTQSRHPTPPKNATLPTFTEVAALLLALAGMGTVLLWGLAPSFRPTGINGSILPEAGHPSNAELGKGSVGPDSQPSQKSAWRAPSFPVPATQTPAAPPAYPTWRLPPPVSLPPSKAGAPSPTATSTITVPPPRIPAAQPFQQAQSPRRLQAAVAFTDLPANHWARRQVDDLSAQGLLAGYPDGSFQPEQPVSRAEFAAQLSNVFTLSIQSPPHPFSDVPAEYWASESIRRTTQMGFLKGMPEGLFEPEKPISRAEVLVALAQGLRLSSSAPANVVLQRYRDRNDIPAWAIPGLVSATQAGLVINHPEADHLEPNRAATRAEVAAILHQSLVYLGEANPMAAY